MSAEADHGLDNSPDFNFEAAETQFVPSSLSAMALDSFFSSDSARGYDLYKVAEENRNIPGNEWAGQANIELDS